MHAPTPYAPPAAPPPAPASPPCWTATLTSAQRFEIDLGGAWVTFYAGLATPVSNADKAILQTSGAQFTFAPV